MPAGTELQEPDPLPRTGGQSAIGDGDIDRRTDEGGFNMGLTISIMRSNQQAGGGGYRHIILALRGMSVQIALLIGRGNAVQSIAHIRADIVVKVLVERDGAAGMLDEQVEHADLVVAQFGELGEDIVGDEVGAAGAGGEREGFLKPGHGGRMGMGFRGV